MKNGRYYRECNFGPHRELSHPEAEPYLQGAHPDSPSPPERWGDAQCRTWLEPEHKLLEDGLFRSFGDFTAMEPGPFRTWHENGRLKADIQLPTGHGVQYWSNGRKASEGEFVDGCRWGEWNHWRESGRLSLRGYYRDCWPIGTWTQWYDNGVRAFECEYGEGGTRERRSFWRKSGTKIGDVFYENHEKLNWICWDERGRPADCSWGQWKVLYGTMEGPTPDSQTQ